MKHVLLAATGFSMLATAAFAQAVAPSTPLKPPASAAATPTPGAPAMAAPPVAPPPVADAKPGPGGDDMADGDMALAHDGPPPPPQGMRPHRPPRGPGGPRIHIARMHGDVNLDVTCSPGESTRECASVAGRLIERLNSTDAHDVDRGNHGAWRRDGRQSDDRQGDDGRDWQDDDHL